MHLYRDWLSVDNPSPWTYKDLLEFHGVTVKDFKNLRLSHKPQLVYTLLTTVFPEFRPQLRRTLKKGSGKGGALAQRLIRTLPAALQVGPTLGKTIHKIVDDCKLYDSRSHDVETQVLGKFSYNDFDSKYVDGHEAACPHCGVHEDLHEWQTLEDLDNFKHVTGPYYRCTQCDKVGRPTLTGAKLYHEGELDDWEWYSDGLDELIAQLVDGGRKQHLPEPDRLYVEGSNLDWRGRSGYTTCDLDGESLAKAMSVNGDFAISDGVVLQPEGVTGYMTCTMSHHDAPTGGSLMVSPAWDCELDGELVVADDILDKRLPKAAEILLCGEDYGHPFTPETTFNAVSPEGLREQLDEMKVRMRIEDDNPLAYYIDTLDLKSENLVDAAKALRHLLDKFWTEKEYE